MNLDDLCRRPWNDSGFSSSDSYYLWIISFAWARNHFFPLDLKSDSWKMRKLLLIQWWKLLISDYESYLFYKMFMWFFLKVTCHDSVNQVHVQHNEKLHHVSNITHSILSWLIFNCGGFCTTKIGDMSPMGKNLEIHENSVRRHFAVFSIFREKVYFHSEISF